MSLERRLAKLETDATRDEPILAVFPRSVVPTDAELARLTRQWEATGRIGPVYIVVDGPRNEETTSDGRV